MRTTLVLFGLLMAVAHGYNHYNLCRALSSNPIQNEVGQGRYNYLADISEVGWPGYPDIIMLNTEEQVVEQYGYEYLMRIGRVGPGAGRSRQILVNRVDPRLAGSDLTDEMIETIGHSVRHENPEPEYWFEDFPWDGITLDVFTRTESTEKLRLVNIESGRLSDPAGDVSLDWENGKSDKLTKLIPFQIEHNSHLYVTESGQFWYAVADNARDAPVINDLLNCEPFQAAINGRLVFDADVMHVSPYPQGYTDDYPTTTLLYILVGSSSPLSREVLVFGDTPVPVNGTEAGSCPPFQFELRETIPTIGGLAVSSACPGAGRDYDVQADDGSNIIHNRFLVLGFDPSNADNLMIREYPTTWDGHFIEIDGVAEEISYQLFSERLGSSWSLVPGTFSTSPTGATHPSEADKELGQGHPHLLTYIVDEGTDRFDRKVRIEPVGPGGNHPDHGQQLWHRQWTVDSMAPRHTMVMFMMRQRNNLSPILIGFGGVVLVGAVGGGAYGLRARNTGPKAAAASSDAALVSAAETDGASKGSRRGKRDGGSHGSQRSKGSRRSQRSKRSTGSNRSRGSRKEGGGPVAATNTE